MARTTLGTSIAGELSRRGYSPPASSRYPSSIHLAHVAHANNAYDGILPRRHLGQMAISSQQTSLTNQRIGNAVKTRRNLHVLMGEDEMKLEFASRFCLREMARARFGLGGGLFADTTILLASNFAGRVWLCDTAYTALIQQQKMAPKKAPAPKQENVQLGPQAREGK